MLWLLLGGLVFLFDGGTTADPMFEESHFAFEFLLAKFKTKTTRLHVSYTLKFFRHLRLSIQIFSYSSCGVVSCHSFSAS